MDGNQMFSFVDQRRRTQFREAGAKQHRLLMFVPSTTPSAVCLMCHRTVAIVFSSFSPIPSLLRPTLRA